MKMASRLQFFKILERTISYDKWLVKVIYDKGIGEKNVPMGDLTHFNGRLSTIFHKRDNICDFLFAFFAHQVPSKKGVYPKRKDFAPFGSKVFPFRVDPFSEEGQIQLSVTYP